MPLVLVNVALMVKMPAGALGTGVGLKLVSSAGFNVTRLLTTGKNSKAPMSHLAAISHQELRTDA